MYQRETFPFSFYSYEKQLYTVSPLNSIFIARNWSFGTLPCSRLVSVPVNTNFTEMR